MEDETGNEIIDAIIMFLLLLIIIPLMWIEDLKDYIKEKRKR